MKRISLWPLDPGKDTEKKQRVRWEKSRRKLHGKSQETEMFQEVVECPFALVTQTLFMASLVDAVSVEQ